MTTENPDSLITVKFPDRAIQFPVQRLKIPTDSPSWIFGATASTGLAGIRELFLLIKKTKSRDLAAQFRLGAEVQTAWGLRRYSNERLLDPAYPLKP
jgi:hypothetical protein